MAKQATKTTKTTKTTKLSAAVTAALLEVFAAEGAAESARGTAQEIAKAKAAVLFSEMRPKPANGKALDAHLKRIRAGAEADGMKTKCDINVWKNSWSHIGAYCYLLLRPRAATEVEKNGKKITLSSASVGTKAADVQKLAAHIRAQEGTGKPKAQRSPSHNDKVVTPTPADVARLAEKNFKVNADSIKMLVERIMKAQSGIGLLADCLKAHGWGLAKLSEK